MCAGFSARLVLCRTLATQCSKVFRFLIPPEAAAWSLDPAGTWEQTAEYRELRNSGKLFEVVQEHVHCLLFWFLSHKAQN